MLYLEKEKDKVDFTNLTPEMQIKKAEISKLYEKSLLTSDKNEQSNYSKNTTTWD